MAVKRIITAASVYPPASRQSHIVILHIIPRIFGALQPDGNIVADRRIALKRCMKSNLLETNHLRRYPFIAGHRSMIGRDVDKAGIHRQDAAVAVLAFYLHRAC